MNESKEIFLEPVPNDHFGDRDWCQDDVWGGSVRYVLGDDHDRVVAERDALQQLLNQRDEQVEALKLSHQGKPVAWTEVDVLDFMSVALRHAEYSGIAPSDILDGLRYMAEKGKPAYIAAQPAPVAAPLDYGSLDAVQRLALCRGDVLPASAAPAEPDRIKGMVETIGGQYAVMIDPENGHYGWTFKKHPDGQWVSGRKATEREMIAARSHAQITNQL